MPVSKGLLGSILLAVMTVWPASHPISAQAGINDLLRLLPTYPDSALSVLDEHINQTGLDDDSTRARYFSYKGLANYYAGNLYVSAELYERALETDWARTNDLFRGNICNNLGIVYNLTARYKEAMEVYLISLEIEENTGNALGAAQTRLNIGLLHSQMGQYDLARELLNKARDYFETAENTEGLALALHNLAMVTFNEGNTQEAEDLVIRAMALYKEVGNEYEWVNVKLNLVRIALEKKNLEVVKNLLDELEQDIDRHQYAFLNTQLDLLKSEYFFELGDFNKARTYLERVDDPNELITLEKHELEILIAAQSGELAAVKDRIDDLQVYRDSMNSMNIGKLTNELHIQYGTERKVLQIRLQHDRLRRRNIALALSGLAVVLLTLLSVRVTISNRKLRQSYQALFEKEKETQRQFDRITKTPQTFSHLEEVTLLRSPDTDTPINIEATDNHHADLWKQLLEVMRTQEPYLDPNLKLNDLAVMCNSNRTYVSKCISANAGQNFSSFINRYRVEKAKREMLEHPGYSFQAIGEQCGFRAGSSFFRVFKEQTGLTPSQYAEMARKDRE